MTRTSVPSAALALLLALVPGLWACGSTNSGQEKPAYVCSPDTCTGCCAGNFCYAGNGGSAQCGEMGVACVTCRSPNVCTGGACVAPSPALESSAHSVALFPIHACGTGPLDSEVARIEPDARLRCDAISTTAACSKACLERAIRDIRFEEDGP